MTKNRGMGRYLPGETGEELAERVPLGGGKKRLDKRVFTTPKTRSGPPFPSAETTNERAVKPVKRFGPKRY